MILHLLLCLLPFSVSRVLIPLLVALPKQTRVKLRTGWILSLIPSNRMLFFIDVVGVGPALLSAGRLKAEGEEPF